MLNVQCKQKTWERKRERERERERELEIMYCFIGWIYEVGELDYTWIY